MAYKVQKIFVKPRHALYEALDNYAFLAKNLYNSVLYRHRQDYKEGKKKLFGICWLMSLELQINLILERCLLIWLL